MQPFNPSNPGNPNEKKKTGSGFTNLNRIMQSNQGNRLGQAVGGGVANQANQARNDLNQARTGFETEAEKNRLDSEQNKQAASKTLDLANQGANLDDNTVGQFQTFRSGRYEGPQAIQNEDRVVAQAQQAQGLGDLSRSTGGRQALLQRFVGDAGYTQGKQRLDNLLLGQSGAQNLRDARRQSQGLAMEAASTADTARDKAQYLANTAQAFGQDVNSRLDTSNTQNVASVDADVTAVSQNEALKQALYKQIQDKLKADDFRTGFNPHNDAKNTNLTAVNEALSLAQANNIAQAGDTDLVKKMYSNLMTPAELLYRQKIQGDTGGMLGFGEKATARETTTSGGNSYSNLGINEVLANAFKTTGAENIDRAGVASNLQRAKESALAKLAQRQAIFSDADKKFKASSAAFDMNQAGRTVDEEIARLKGVSVQELPTVYENTPLEQKLQRAFAPTGAQALSDSSEAFNKVTSSNSSLGDRGAGLASLALTPTRAMNGEILNQANALKRGAETGFNDIFSGNVAKGATELYTLPLNSVQAAQNNVANTLKSIPVVGNLLSKPAALASSATGKATQAAAQAAQAAQNAVSNIVSGIGSIFCYGAGTKIKMKNGSFKAVEKLQLGDEVYYGGKVTATGKALEDDIYDYLGCKVTGSHSVFENGKFVRVQDSEFANKVPGKKEIEVFPIETEKHILVTDTHMGADFSEIDEGHNVSPEERLEKLNSDAARLKKLDTAAALIFKSKNDNK